MKNKPMKLVLKGGKASGWYRPPKGSHTGSKHRETGSGKSGIPTGRPTMVGEATDYKWNAEDSVTLTTVIESREKLSRDDLADYLRSESKIDLDPDFPPEIKKLEYQKAEDGYYIHLTAELTPTEDAAQDWADRTGGEEEWELYHE